MKNMKVSAKLILSFVIVIILTAVIGLIGIFGMSQLNNAEEEMYALQLEPITLLSDATTNMATLRVGIRDLTMATADANVEKVEATYATMKETEASFLANLDEFETTIVAQEIRDAYDDARSTYEAEYAPLIESMYETSKTTGDAAAMRAAIAGAADFTTQIDDDLNLCMEIKLQQASDSNIAGSELYQMLLVIILIVLGASVVIALFLAFYISGMISKPLITLTGFMKRAGTTGDVVLEPADVEAIGKYALQKDETGQCISATASFINRVNEVSGVLETVSNGDLTPELAPLSDKDKLGHSLQTMTNNLNQMFREIHASTAQVSIGAKQVADGSQSLAQGATEQAASTQELSSSIAEIAEKTKANAGMAEKAASLANTIKANAEKGSNQMNEMTEAVKEISIASQSISKIMKTIDDIAFQTNILALNAAVEAARAGQHGKGFAVVAEEVRNLAAKSADAAKDTDAMIQNSMEKSEQGVRIAGDTAASLVDIVAGINESSHLVTAIAESSEEQAASISEINTGIDQVAQVVQQNSATAEESAAASEEMSSQSAMLEDLISQFKIRGEAGRFGKSVSSAQTSGRAYSQPTKSQDGGDEYDDGYNDEKY